MVQVHFTSHLRNVAPREAVKLAAIRSARRSPTSLPVTQPLRVISSTIKTGCELTSPYLWTEFMCAGKFWTTR